MSELSGHPLVLVVVVAAASVNHPHVVGSAEDARIALGNSCYIP